MNVQDANRHDVKSQVLTGYLSQFRRGLINRKRFEGLVFHSIQKNLFLYAKTVAKDELLDFLSWLYPRLVRAIERYEDKGFSFDTYIYAVVKFASKEYKKLGEIRRYAEESYWDCAASKDSAAETYTMHNPETHIIRKEEREITLPSLEKPRQVLILLLKSYHLLSDELIANAAAHLAMRVDDIHELVGRLKALREATDRKCFQLRERIHSQYHRLINCQYRLSLTSPDTYHYQELQASVSLHKKRLCNMRNTYRRIKKTATNREIADVLGIPKGTVDSTLYTLKKRMEKDAQQDICSLA
jgi:RNA polymerase sigma factor (sigma-70 family)